MAESFPHEPVSRMDPEFTSQFSSLPDGESLHRETPESSNAGNTLESTSRILPTSEVFLSDPSDSPSTAAVVSKPKLPGPGFGEGLLWLVGALMVNGIGSLVGFTLMLLTNPDLWQPSNLAEFKHNLEHLAANGHLEGANLYVAVLFGLLASALYTIVALRVRLGVLGLRGLGWRLPSAVQCLAIVGLMLPLSLLCTELFQEVRLRFPSSGHEFEATMNSLAKAPTAMLIVMLAILPALWEELLFRGLIGSGLLSRWGLLRGVLWTSVLFGIMHINPAQALAVIPLGIVLHFVYLTTRSLWAPMLLHFLNNAWAVYALKSEPLQSLQETVVPQRLPLPLLTVSLTTATALLLLLWQTRTRFVRADGSDWSPGYTSLETPHGLMAWFGIVRERPRALLVVCSGICLLGFLGVVWQLATYGVLASK